MTTATDRTRQAIVRNSTVIWFYGKFRIRGTVVDDPSDFWTMVRVDAVERLHRQTQAWVSIEDELIYHVLHMPVDMLRVDDQPPPQPADDGGEDVLHKPTDVTPTTTGF